MGWTWWMFDDFFRFSWWFSWDLPKNGDIHGNYTLVSPKMAIEHVPFSSVLLSATNLHVYGIRVVQLLQGIGIFQSCRQLFWNIDPHLDRANHLWFTLGYRQCGRIHPSIYIIYIYIYIYYIHTCRTCNHMIMMCTTYIYIYTYILIESCIYIM